MLVEIDGRYVNIASINSIERLAPNDRGLERHRIHFVAKSGSVEVRVSSEQLDRFCGTIVPAPAGYRSIDVIPPDSLSEATLFDEWPVIAFRVSGSFGEAPIPITMRGEPQEYHALVAPDGRCEGLDEVFDDVEAFKAAAAKRFARKDGVAE